MFFGVKLANRIGFRLTSLISMIGFSGFIFISSFVKNFWIFMMIYGIGPPLMLGLVYMLPIHCGWAYFPKSKGVVTGLVAGAFGLATSIFNPISTYIANPNNLKPTIFI